MGCVSVPIFTLKIEKYLYRIEYCLRALDVPEMTYNYDALRVCHDALRVCNDALRRDYKVHVFMSTFKCILSALLDCVMLHIHRRELYKQCYLFLTA